MIPSNKGARSTTEAQIEKWAGKRSLRMAPSCCQWCEGEKKRGTQCKLQPSTQGTCGPKRNEGNANCTAEPIHQARLNRPASNQTHGGGDKYSDSSAHGEGPRFLGETSWLRRARSVDDMTDAIRAIACIRFVRAWVCVGCALEISIPQTHGASQRSNAFHQNGTPMFRRLHPEDH